MAKLKAPLLSLGASGAIGKAIVFFNWKGLDVAREYVVPSNPQTTGQTTQRDYLTACVAAVHAAQALAANPLVEADTSAYALLGSTLPTPRTWFNEIAKRWLDCMVASKHPVIYRNGNISDKTANSIDLIMYLTEESGGALTAGKFYFGTSKTALIHAVTATVSGSISVYLADSDCSAFLTKGTKYFVQFRPDSGTASEGARSGIYHFVAE